MSHNFWDLLSVCYAVRFSVGRACCPPGTGTINWEGQEGVWVGGGLVFGGFYQFSASLDRDSTWESLTNSTRP